MDEKIVEAKGEMTIHLKRAIQNYLREHENEIRMGIAKVHVVARDVNTGEVREMEQSYGID